MWPVMIGNVLIETAYVCGGVILILKDHPWWGGICIIAGVFSGVSLKIKKELNNAQGDT